VDVTPLVVEKDSAIVSWRQGVPRASWTPAQMSTTGTPRW